MERISHVYVQEYSETHGFLHFVLDSWYVCLSLDNVSVKPSIISTESNKGFVALGAITNGEAQGDVECLYMYFINRSYSVLACSYRRGLIGRDLTLWNWEKNHLSLAGLMGESLLSRSTLWVQIGQLLYLTSAIEGTCHNWTTDHLHATPIT